MSYFRPYFEANPSLLKEKGNEDLIDDWKRDHPGYTKKDVQRARQNLANLKSFLRRKEREGQFATRNSTAPAGVTLILPTAGEEIPALEILEGQIDDCLMMAKKIDRDGLEEVIRNLRLARNEVVLKLP
jgi:hypothetical protein